MRWRPSPAFSINRKPIASRRSPRPRKSPIAPELIEADGYSKVGPGPMAAIRFKWTVRCDEHGEYYVDETIGENSVPIVSGPLTRDAAIRLVDDRESEARSGSIRSKAK